MVAFLAHLIIIMILLGIFAIYWAFKLMYYLIDYIIRRIRYRKYVKKCERINKENRPYVPIKPPYPFDSYNWEYDNYYIDKENSRL